MGTDRGSSAAGPGSSSHTTARCSGSWGRSPPAIAPGAFLGADELFEAGWPGQRATVGSARARVYTTVHRLRKLGLGLAVRSGARGFALDPTGVVIRDGHG